MNPEDILFDLKRNYPNGVNMFFLRSKYKGISQKQWSWIMKRLVNNRKIEVFGELMIVKPIFNEFEKNTSNEILITERLVKDIVSELKRCKPSEAYKYCVQKYGYCNPESFTRSMRKMVEFGELWRDEEGYYSLTPLVRL